MAWKDARAEQYAQTEKGRETRRRANAAFLQRNREKRNAYMRAWWRAQDPDKKREDRRRARYRFKYGITVERYQELLTSQSGHCALCSRTPEQERYKHLNVDHCHHTGKVRGLLCTPCNSAIGALGDNEDGLLLALKYVRGGV